MGSGSNNLYIRLSDGTRRYIGKHPRRAWYQYRGKYYLITGNAWTGFYRNEISKNEYEHLISVLSEDFDRRKISKNWWQQPTKLQKANYENWEGNYLKNLLKQERVKA